MPGDEAGGQDGAARDCTLVVTRLDPEADLVPGGDWDAHGELALTSGLSQEQVGGRGVGRG